MLHFDMLNLELAVPGEAGTRKLACRLLQADEANDANPLTSNQLEELFSVANEHHDEPGDANDEAANCEAEAAADDENEVAMEGQNLLHAMPPMQGDGAELHEDVADEAGEDIGCTMVLNDKKQDFPFAEAAAPMIPVGIAPGEDPTVYKDCEFSDEEPLKYEPLPKHLARVPFCDDEPVGDGSASSSKGPALSSVGLNVTPDYVRSRLPNHGGVKIQHRRSKNPLHLSGWQAWGSAFTPSRFFSYGPTARYTHSHEAMEAAITFCWDEHERVTKPGV